MRFLDMMALEPHGPDTFVGAGPAYPWGGLYGGQIVAQGLRAAGLTVDPQYRVHSLHAYFVRRGDASEPIRFEVERVRNGRSFVTRSLEARQSTGAILTMTASFQIDEDAAEVQEAVMPPVAAPDTLTSDRWTDVFDRRFIEVTDRGCVQAWMRILDETGDDPLLHACALAYMSDDLPTDALVALHPARDRIRGDRDEDSGPQHMAASLDHAIWFHRPARADGWQLQVFKAEGLTGSRGVSVGHFFSAAGVHVATVAQEVLLRVRGTTP